MYYCTHVRIAQPEAYHFFQFFPRKQPKQRTHGHNVTDAQPDPTHLHPRFGQPSTAHQRGVPEHQSKKELVLINTRPCIDTSNQNKQIHVRIHSTVQVIRARMFILWSVLEVTQRVPHG
jgi:hypothetical protein